MCWWCRDCSQPRRGRGWSLLCISVRNVAWLLSTFGLGFWSEIVGFFLQFSIIFGHSISCFLRGCLSSVLPGTTWSLLLCPVTGTAAGGGLCNSIATGTFSFSFCSGYWPSHLVDSTPPARMREKFKMGSFPALYSGGGGAGPTWWKWMRQKLTK